MKITISLISACLLLIRPVEADLLIQPHDFVAICGDSITEQRQYSVFMEDYLLMCQPVDGLQVDQFGSAGESAPGFTGRVTNEVLSFKPTVATTCYGMNDGHYKPFDQQIEDDYRKGETDIIEIFKQNGVRNIVVGSPDCVDSTLFKQIPADVYNDTLQKLSDVAADVAKKEGVPFADVHTPAVDVMKKMKAAYGANFAWAGGDGIHPNACGHIVMAYAFLKALGCDGNIGTITVEMALQSAEGTPGQKIISFKDGTLDIESTRYPFCFWGDASSPDATTGAIKFFPFNEDLNRYILIVKGLTTPNAKITWGKETKEFSSADLAKGINLAAEFLDNPFVSQFEAVDQAVRKQQESEVFLTLFMRNAGDTKKILRPESANVVDQLIAEGKSEDARRAGEAKALVIPIEHTLKIEPAQ